MTDEPAITPQVTSHLIHEWNEAKRAADYWREREHELREQVKSAVFPGAENGSHTYELGSGYKLRLVQGTNYRLDSSEKVSETIAEIDAATGYQGQGCKYFRFKPELVVSAYNTLNVEYPADAMVKAYIDAVLTTSPASPQLTVIEPKGKDKSNASA